ncbi:MAG: hypothetical protein J7M26_09255, partial [Armatimonadetes bacterium]|nr:hypothetical protein [Armatimonadota bacterium]
MTAETIALALSLAALGAPKSFVADVSLRLAMPDSVAGKSDGMRVRLLAITSAGEQTVAEQDIAPPGWHVVKGRCRLRAGEAYTLRLVLGPRQSPAFDLVGLHSLTVVPAGGTYSRNLLAMASQPRVLLEGKPAPYKAWFYGRRVMIAGEPRTPWLIGREPFGGKRCDIVVDFAGAPFFPDLVNHAHQALARASTCAPNARVIGLKDGRFDLAGEAAWMDTTPDDYPDWAELHFPSPEGVSVSHVLLFMSPGQGGDLRVARAHLEGLRKDRWVTLGDVEEPSLPYVHWPLSPARRLQALRVTILDGKGSRAPILELEAWGPPHAASESTPAAALQVKGPTGPLDSSEAIAAEVTLRLPQLASHARGLRLRTQLETRGGRVLAQRDSALSAQHAHGPAKPYTAAIN